MGTLRSALRKLLENTVCEARTVADQAAADAVARLAIAAARPPAYLSEDQKVLRRRLRAHARSLGDTLHADDTMTTARLAEAAAYEHWHRMLFGRFLVESNLLIHPRLGVPISRGDLKELAEEEGFADEWALVERFAAPSLPAVFKPDDPVLALELDPHFQARLRTLVTALPDEVFAADDSLGWTYQFWRAAEKKAINEKQVKIGAAELPAVTQLFTEPYMVKFLLHNTLGAWWAGKVLAADPDLARNAPDEDALRESCALPGIEWEYLRFVRDPLPNPPPLVGEGRVGAGAAENGKETAAVTDGNGSWRPAAGAFPRWPKRAAEITYLDPCCGSGHFLVKAFAIFAALRQEEEGLSPEEAGRAVLRDNLHGLEIDGRCVQIAAFNVALAAWRCAGAPIKLPVPHVAWVGAPPPLPKSEFIALANGDAELQRGLAALHDLFRQAPLRGSLIELTGGDLVDPTRVAQLDQSIAALVESMRDAEPERAEGALAARGMADAAALLHRRFSLAATNPPFLGQGEFSNELMSFMTQHHKNAKGDLSTAMLERMNAMVHNGGTVAAVAKQEWCFLPTFYKFRRQKLEANSFHFFAFLGEEAWETFGNRGPKATLLSFDNFTPTESTEHFIIDATLKPDRNEKCKELESGALSLLTQAGQYRNPKCRISASKQLIGIPLSEYAFSCNGVVTGDADRFVHKFWESKAGQEDHWIFQQTATKNRHIFSGMDRVVRWDDEFHSFIKDRLGDNPGMWIRGTDAWGKLGVVVSGMRYLNRGMYIGSCFDNNCSIVIAKDQENTAAIWSFCMSAGYVDLVKSLNPKVSVTDNTFVQVPFDLAQWQKVAAEKYPNGLPEPYSDDPTQWLFHGHPQYAEPGTELHVVLARLAGYRWPAERDTEMRLSAEARARVAEAATLPEADADGLLPLVPVLGERPLADRLRTYCAAAWGEAWTQGSEAALVAAACERAKDRPPRQPTFDAWLRSHAARQHAKLFHDRPFLWWIGDGRADGFTVVAHYHRLDHANLERLAYTMLGDWISRLGDDPHAEFARILQQKLAQILEGEPPYDIFVRWKPLGRQPLGWEPDLDDGVRLNIRPFVEAKVSAHVPNVSYRVDRGKDVPSAPWYDIFKGERRNDHHTTLAEKRAARERPLT